jgi:uncharacterized protein (DUF1015 family)
MATLVPFRALRPAPESASRVAAVPYDVVSTSEARELGAREPLSFLHVSRPEIDVAPGVDPYSSEVYAQARSALATLKRNAPLVLEPEPSVYIYRLAVVGHRQTGVAGCFALDEYDRGVVRKHELTRREKEDDRTRHILAVSAQTGPVFLTHRATSAIRTVTVRAARQAPLFDFTALDGVQHTVWRCGDDDAQLLVELFADVPALYIADGHHRAAAAARARRQLGATAVSGDRDSFLAVTFPHDEVRVLPYHRVVRDLGSHTSDGLLRELRSRFDVSEGSAVPARRGDVAVYLGDRWYTVVLGAASGHIGPDERLDVSRLQQLILGPLLGIGEVTTDRRIDFVGGVRGTGVLEQLVRSGEAAVAFSMHPVTVDDIMQISDAGGIMPPKSSWFEPKLRDGLLVHEI